MQVPRVSVIVPARNSAEYIEDALQSVVAQAFTDWELIVADDGSTDATAEVARGVDPRIKVVQNPRSGGPAAARNAAIAHARGELLAFLDADDQWLPEYLERQVGLFDAESAANGKVGIVACNAFVREHGKLRDQPYSAFAGPARGATLETLLRGNPIFVSAVMPRAAVLEAGGLEPATSPSEDHDLWIRLVELGYRVVATDEPLAIYRKHGSNISKDAVRMARTSALVYRRALARGKLTAAQRRIARRSLVLQRSVRAIEEFLRYPNRRTAPPRVWIHGVAGTLGLLWYALLSPHQWPEWVLTLARGGRAPWRPKWDV